MKKFLSTRPTLQWQYLPYLVSKVLNNGISPKIGFKPAEMVFGKEGAGQMYLDSEKLAPPHHIVMTDKEHIESITADIRKMTAEATDRLTQLRLITNKRLNKTQVKKEFKPGDYVFTIDRTIIPGNPRPLKTKLNPSPYVVLRPIHTTTLIRRLADGFTTLYSNNDLKLYSGSSPLFNMLPPEVSKVLLHDFKDLLSSDLTTITKHDPLNVPNAVKLYTENAPETESDLDDTADAARSDDIDMKIPPLNSEIEKAGKMVENVQDEILIDDDNTAAVESVDKNMTDEELILLQQAEKDDIQADVDMLHNDVPNKALDEDDLVNTDSSSDDDNAENMYVDIYSGPPARNLRPNPSKTVRFDKTVS